MENLAPIFWIVAGFVLLILEMVTGAFVLLFFGISALMVAAAKYAGLQNLPVEIVIFALGGMAGLLLFRGKLQSALKGKHDISIDQNTVFVLDADVPPRGTAKVHYQGVVWTAVNPSDDELKKGTEASIQGTEGVKLIIKRSGS